MKPNEHLFRCLDIIKADKTLSEDTLIIMFVEYARLVTEQSRSSEWVYVKDKKPNEYGRYEVYREKCGKQYYETWNNTGWAYNNNDITHWRPIKSPYIR